MKYPYSKSRSGERGAALVIVLLLLALFAGLVADFLYTIRINTYLAGNKTDQVQAKAVAEAGVAAAKGLLLHSRPFSKGGHTTFQNDYFNLFQCKCYTTGGLGSAATAFGQTQEQQQQALAQNNQNQNQNQNSLENNQTQTMTTDCGEWSMVIDYPMGDQTLHLEIYDEQARININGLVKRSMNPEDTGMSVNDVMKPPVIELIGLKMKELGIQVQPQELTGLVDMIVDWEDFGQAGGTLDKDLNETYQDGDLQYSNKNGPMDTVSEIKMIPGINDELYYALRDFLTVYPMNLQTGDPLWKVNTDVASIGVIYALVRAGSYQGETPTMSEDEALDAAQQIVATGMDDKGFMQSREIPADLKSKVNPGNFIFNADVAQNRWYHLKSTGISPSGINYTIEAVVMVPVDSKIVRVVYWKEG